MSGRRSRRSRTGRWPPVGRLHAGRYLQSARRRRVRRRKIAAMWEGGQTCASTPIAAAWPTRPAHPVPPMHHPRGGPNWARALGSTWFGREGGGVRRHLTDAPSSGRLRAASARGTPRRRAYASAAPAHASRSRATRRAAAAHLRAVPIGGPDDIIVSRGGDGDQVFGAARSVARSRFRAV